LDFLNSGQAIGNGYGGIFIALWQYGIYLVPATPTCPGIQLFTGSDSAPTFTLGTFNFTDVAYDSVSGGPGNGNPATLVISTPEPSALVLLLTVLLASTVFLGLKRVAA
jgi:hypothetical protein